MVVIHLTNFRCFKQKTIVLPDTGCILLNGPSGVGKTTVFKAINFALYGKEQKCVTIGEKKCKVEVEFSFDGVDYKLVRTKSPTHFTLKINQPTEIYLEDEPAQIEINKRFGEHFFLTGYITQKGVESFFGLSKDEKTEFLQRLSVEQFDVNDLRSRVRIKIRERKDALNNIVSKIEYLKTLIPNSEAEIEEPVFPIKLVEDETKSINEEKHQRELNSKKLTKLRSELQHLQDKKMRWMDFLATQKRISELREKLASYPADISSDINGLHTLIEASQQTIQEWDAFELWTSKQELLSSLESAHSQRMEKVLSELISKKERLKGDTDKCVDKDVLHSLRQLLQLLSECPYEMEADTHLSDVGEMMRSTLSDLAEVGEQKLSIDRLQRHIDELKRDLDRNNTEADHLRSLLRGSKMECPGCRQSLFLTSDRVLHIRKEEEVKAKLEETNIKIKELNHDLKKNNEEWKERSAEMQSSKEDYNTLAAWLKKWDTCVSRAKGVTLKLVKLESYVDSRVSKESFEKELSEVERQITKAASETYPTDALYVKTKEWLESRSVPSQPSVTKQECEERIKKYKKEKNDLTLQLSRKEETEQDIERLERAFGTIVEESEQNLDDTILKVQADIATREKKSSLFEKRAEQIQKYLFDKESFEKHRKMVSDLEELKSDEKIALRALTVAESVLRKIGEAESETLSNTLAIINSELEDYIDHFFDEQLSVQLVGHKETIKGEKKSCIDIKITRGGEDVPFDILSGGEFDRVALAVFLAFNGMSRTKLILLDECLASLHSELVEKIVEFIKERNKDKLILVTLHQANTGLFDEVVGL